MSIANDSTLVPLDRAELIDVFGADAIEFAHAQFSSDVAALAAGAWQWSAWLTAQGRTRAVFVLLRIAPDHLLIWLPLGGAEPMRDALQRFVLRAKVQVALREVWSLRRLDQDLGLDDRSRRITEHLGGYAFAQPGPQLRTAWLGPAPPVETDIPALDAWRAADIAAGLPWLDAATRDEFVPQALSLEHLEAVRFDKGCYPGQEIAARLHFRGGVKQRLQRLILQGAHAAPGGTAITSATGNSGTVLYSARISAENYAALAVLAETAIDAASLQTSSGHTVIRIEPW